MIQSHLIFLLIGAGSLIRASPTSSSALASSCAAVSPILSEFKNIGTSTQLCSSFLPITTQTSTSYATVTASTTATVTRTGAGVSAAAPAVTTTTTFTTTLTTCKANQKRATASGCTSSVLPPCLTGYACTSISTACNCLSLYTPSTTVTKTSTVSPTVTNTVNPTTTYTPTTTISTTTTVTKIACVTSTAPSLCGNQGLQWAYYTDIPSNMDNPGGTDYPSFDPTAYQKVMPSENGTTSSIGGFNYAGGSTTTIYNNPTVVSQNYFVVDHRGYIYADETGQYTFTVSSVDDIVFIWYGATAISGWTRDNGWHTSVNQQRDNGVYSINLQAGTLTPIRIMFGQAQGPASFNIQAQNPDGTTFLSGTSSYLIQYPCNTNPQPFPKWGSET